VGAGLYSLEIWVGAGSGAGPGAGPGDVGGCRPVQPVDLGGVQACAACRLEWVQVLCSLEIWVGAGSVQPDAGFMELGACSAQPGDLGRCRLCAAWRFGWMQACTACRFG
jgi:hypothetical protein